MKKRKDGRYCKELTINGKRHSFYGATQNEVFAKIREFEEKEELGRSFEEVADEFREDCENRLAPSSLLTYRPCIRRAKEYFKDIPIKDITPAMINSFIMGFCEKQPSRKTAAHQLMIVSLICKKAIIEGDIEHNPAQYIKIPTGLKKTKRNLPEDKELEKIEFYTSLEFGLFPYFLLYTGLRKGEALALNYTDIDFKNNIIHITKSVAYKSNQPFIKAPKTDNGVRDIPLLDKLKNLLDDKKTGLVFPNHDGGYMTKSQFDVQWERYTKESGINCTPHQIRHAYATIIFEAGISAKDAQGLLGHADITTTNNIYTHIRESKREDTRNVLNNHLYKTSK